MNILFFVMVIAAFLAAAWRQVWWVPETPEATSPMQELTNGALSSAAGAVEIAISLIGGMALFLGVMKVAEAGGLMQLISRAIRPVMVLLFPDVPPDHPAMGAMILNMSANALGLGNAATPFGIKAMQELDKLNPEKGTATNAMALFLAINTSSVTLLPTGVMVIRERLGSLDPGGIFGTTLVATAFSTLTAVLAAKLFQRLASPDPAARGVPDPAPHPDPTIVGPQPGGDDESTLAEPFDRDAVPIPAEPAGLAWTVVGLVSLALLGLLLPRDAAPWLFLLVGLRGALHFARIGPRIGALDALLVALAVVVLSALRWGAQISPWVIPVLIAGMLVFGMVRGVKVYETLVQGAKEGFNIAVMIIPYLVAILVAVGMLRASGALDAIIGVLNPFTAPLGMPAEALPMAFLRPLSGSGASGLMISIMSEPATGPDTYVGYLVSTIQGSTETTFYVMAVYFGAVGVHRMRHTMAAALTADFMGIVAAVVAVSWYWSTL